MREHVREGVCVFEGGCVRASCVQVCVIVRYLSLLP